MLMRTVGSPQGKVNSGKYLHNKLKVVVDCIQKGWDSKKIIQSSSLKQVRTFYAEYMSLLSNDLNKHSNNVFGSQFRPSCTMTTNQRANNDILLLGCNLLESFSNYLNKQQQYYFMVTNFISCIRNTHELISNKCRCCNYSVDRDIN